MNVFIRFICAVIPGIAITFGAYAGHHNEKKMMSASSQNIVEVAAAAGQFDTLIAAAKAAGLVGALTGDGPLTVFAPTDEAFAKLPESTVETLLKPENKDQLVAILSYHVASGKLNASDVIARDSIATIGGRAPAVSVNDGTVKIDNATVVKVDIPASNGVIHVIDTVLLPPQKQAMNARSVIELAIDRGAPLYNRGQEKACADLYEVAITSLLALDAELGENDRRTLRNALKKASHSHNARENAWTYRRAMDAVYHGHSMDRMAAR